MKVAAEILSSVPFEYARDVKSGKIPTGPYVKKAVARFYAWIKNADKKGYVLDHVDGMHVIEFFETFLKHTKGVKAGEPFFLSPYQQFTLYNIFGWKKKNQKGDYVRVIKTVYEKVARKNGKTAVLAGLGLYCLMFDNEEGPEIYVGATKEAQAKILWDQAYQFVYKSRALRLAGCQNTQREIRFLRKLGTFKYLGGDSKTLDGLSPNLGIIDEYHSHKDDSVREVIESAMGARKQPLMYIITTAGFNKVSACKLYEDVCKQILDGEKEDDSTFIMIHEPAEDDDWELESTWIKANPNLGTSVNLDYLRAEHTKAVNQPSKAPNFKTKHVNLWVEGSQVWIPAAAWDKNKVDTIPRKKFKKFGAFAGGDLSTRTDITAYVILSEPDKNGDRYIKPFFFCPEESIEHRSKIDRAPYQQWVDYEYFKDKIFETYYPYKVKRIELDQWNASQVANDLAEKGLEVSFFSQAISVISYPTKQFEILVMQGKLKHDGNPILKWMLSGCKIYQDPNENIKVHKGQSHAGNYRVDGIIALIMALGGSLSIEDDSSESNYNDDRIEAII